MISIPDLVNGLFEAFGGFAVFGNVATIMKDKQIRGISPWACAFFTSWGWWNLYFYPHLHQWLSFTGGLAIVAGNTLWVALIIKYRKN